MTTDSCLQRPDKTASATVYLMEELGDARMRCDQLVKYVAEAAKLIENSTHRDHFFEVAGHLIQGIPHIVFLLQKALQATALAATRIDYEEIKQDLRPEKVDELERALQDVRVRQVQRRSEPWTPMQAAQALRGMAAKIRESGHLPKTDLMALILGLEFGLKKADASSTAQALETILTALESANTPPSQLHLATSLRQVFADDLLRTTQEQVTMDKTAMEWKTKTAAEMPAKFDPTFQQQLSLMTKSPPKVTTTDAGIVIEVFSPFVKKYIPMAEYPSEEAANKDLSVWMKAHRETLQNLRSAIKSDKTAAESPVPDQRIKSAISSIEHDLKDIEHHLGKSADNRPHEDIGTLFNSIRSTSATMARRFGVKTADDESKESKFEKGKPADPTENMSPEDAKKWKTEHDKHKDNFKAAGDESKESKFEKGKPADPTENMSPEDAKRWKEEHDKHKDNFKSGSAKWVAKGDTLWEADGSGDAITSAQVQEIKGPGIPLYVVKITINDKGVYQYKKELKKLSEAKQMAEKWLKADADGASLVLTDFKKTASGYYSYGR